MPLDLAASAIAMAMLSALSSLFSGRWPRLMGTLVFPLLGLAGLLATIAGLIVLFNGEILTAGIPLGLPWLPSRVRLDALAGFFLVVVGLVVIAVGAYGPAYVRQYEHGPDPLPVLGGFTGLFVAAMLMVVLADDAFLFMVAWELMSLSSYFLVVFQHEHAPNRRAALLYLLMAHIGGLSILLGFGVLTAFGADFSFEAMRGAGLPPLWAGAAFALAFLGFGMKAGLVPLHAWLPEAHPVAPSHVSALMSGVMLKVAVYGFIRVVFDLIGNVRWEWGVVVLVIASVSAVTGVLYALMQHDLKRLLAYHSVENIGIIFIGLGMSLIFLGTGHTLIGVLALVAALYHSINHALFKSLLFLGAGAIIHTCHERDLEHMGGLLKRMPVTGLFFLVGCISISALPPFNGFVSEWLTFQAALQAWSLESGVLRTLIPVSAALLALTGALAAACFVKVYGIAFLGQPRTRRARRAREISPGMRAAQGFLATLCLVLGVLPTLVVSLLDPVAQQVTGQHLGSATGHGWMWLTPISADTASYGAPLVLAGLAAAWWIGSLVLRRGKVRRIRRCEPWDCGFSAPDARMQYTATAFSQPIRRVYGLLFHIDERVGHEGGAIRYHLRITDRAWGLLYAPTARLVQGMARRVAVIQSGSIRNYLGWSLATLLVLLWLIS